jgi:tRNA pseudouridine55 synthase
MSRSSATTLVVDALQPLYGRGVAAALSLRSSPPAATRVMKQRLVHASPQASFAALARHSKRWHSSSDGTVPHGSVSIAETDSSGGGSTSANRTAAENSGRHDDDDDAPAGEVPLYRSEGLFPVHKPINWTSQDVVSFVRGVLEREARDRGADVAKMSFRRQKNSKKSSRTVKVGHGGTLDPLATGVLVIGVGGGTKQLAGYTSGTKRYRAVGRFGVETNTLDLDPKANVTREAAWDHVTREQLESSALPKFVGKIMQTPPIFSAKRQGGKKLYEAARKGLEVTVEPKEVEIHELQLVSVDLPDFTIDMECGGGTFVRSLIRDVAYEVDSVATTAMIQRTKQGPFVLEDCIPQQDWNADRIYACIDEWNAKFVLATEGEETITPSP